MKNSTNSNSWNFEASYFPYFNLPIGVIASYGLDVPDNFSSFYPSDKQPSNPTLFDNEYENKIEIKSRTSKYLVGLKLSNQENRSLINPYISASIGFGVSKSILKEFEFVYWQVEAIDEQGNIKYDENGEPQYETESTRTTLTKKRAPDGLKLIYSYEAGFELSPLHDSYFALKISAGFLGSFSSFPIVSNFEDKGLQDSESVMTEFLNHRRNSKSRLSLWRFSLGLTFRI